MQAEIYVGIPNALYDKVVEERDEALEKVFALEALLRVKNEMILAQNKKIVLLQSPYKKNMLHPFFDDAYKP